MSKKIFVFPFIAVLSVNYAHAFGHNISWPWGGSGSGSTATSTASSSSTSVSTHSSSSASSVSSVSSSSSSSSSSVSSVASSSSQSSINISSGPMPTPTSSDTIKGLDVYHGDDITSFANLLSGGSEFIAAKATQGTSFEDPNYASTKAGAKAAGMVFGAYHFVDLSVDGATQADFFANYVNANGGLQEGDFAMFDWETSSGDPYSSHDGTTIQNFLNEIKVKLKRRCFVYVSPDLVDATGNPSYLSEYPLWIADYNSSPAVPAPWKTWNVWQTTGSASIYGLGNQGDADIFKGSLDDLKTLIKYTEL